jgi:imidazolonepropionase
MGARELKARAISHLEEVSDEGIRAMAESGTVAVVLPTTAYILRLPSPPVRKMISGNVVVALGTDFNPNAYCLSMASCYHAVFVEQSSSIHCRYCHPVCSFVPRFEIYYPALKI